VDSGAKQKRNDKRLVHMFFAEILTGSILPAR
jgi:hypothetical protein